MSHLFALTASNTMIVPFLGQACAQVFRMASTCFSVSRSFAAPSRWT